MQLIEGTMPSDRPLEEVVGAVADLLHWAERTGLLSDAMLGIARDGRTHARWWGWGDPNGAFEIGSLTKLFTADLIADLVANGAIALDEPVVRYVGRASQRPRRGMPVTIMDLATHRSGLPRLPPGVSGLMPDPYASIDAAALKRAFARYPTEHRSAKTFLYSNFGYSVLGLLLARAGSRSFEELLRDRVITRNGMTSTDLAFPGRDRPDLRQGRSLANRRTPPWTFDACAPCGGLRASGGDMVRWIGCKTREAENGSAMEDRRVGLGWMVRPGEDWLWHTGGTAGFGSYASLDPRRRCGVIVLLDRANASLASVIGRSLEAAFVGRPVRLPDTDFGLARARMVEPVRALLRPLSTALSLPTRVLARW